jgi:hypothetical protein
MRGSAVLDGAVGESYEDYWEEDGSLFECYGEFPSGYILYCYL